MKRFACLIFLFQFTLAFGNPGSINTISKVIQDAPSHIDSLQSLNDADEIPYKLVLSFVPQYAMIGGLRFDMDIGITENHWIQVAPILFISDSLALFSRAKQLRGMGIHLYHRYYPANGFGHVPVYFSWGPMYHFAHIKNGAQSSDNANSEQVKIHKAGLDIIIGLYAILGKNFMLDVYAGMGVRHAFFISDEANPKKYNDTYFDYGYSGNILILGMRFGIPVK